MRRPSPIRRIVTLVVAVHLSLLPLLAAAHDASHYRFDPGVSSSYEPETCAGGDRGTHRFHFDANRESPEELLCAFCHLMQQVLDKAQAQQSWRAPVLADSGRVSRPSPDLYVSSPALEFPSNRSPPVSA